MHPTLEKHFRSLQYATDIVLKEVSSVSASTYYHCPAEGKWSISQILTHLLTSEKLSLVYMKKKVQSDMSLIEDATLGTNFRFWLLKISQYVPLHYKAPKVVTDNTPEALSFGDLVREWETVRSEMREFLAKIDAQNLNKTIFKHPYAGKLSASQAVQFMEDHLQHHRPQITRIVRSTRKHRQ